MKNKPFKISMIIFLALCFLGNTNSPDSVAAADKDNITFSNDSSDFVLLSDIVPDAILEIRYYSTYNFVGERINGYDEPHCTFN